MLGALAAFALAAGLLTITPGLDTANVLRGAASGPRVGAAAAVGVVAGLFVWGAAAALGLGVLLTASPAGYTALKWAGAGYLVLAGLRMILQPRSAFDAGASGLGVRAAMQRGFLTNLLNPKIGVFYATFLPQFVPLGAPVAPFCLALAGVHAVLTAIWFTTLIALTAPLVAVLRRPTVVRTMDRTTGGMFVAFGAKLALTRV